MAVPETCLRNIMNNSRPYPAGIYLLKVNNRKTRTRCEICSKLTIKTPEQCQAVTLWIKCFDINTVDEMFNIPKMFCTLI